MGIWRDLYGPQSDDFIKGVIAGVKMCAVWHDGVECVGIRDTPLIEVINEIKGDLSRG